MVAVSEDVPAGREHWRASDADRERVIERLRVAHTEGRLDIHEFDERVAAAWRARTYGELDALIADLPPGPTGTGQEVATPAGRSVEQADGALSGPWAAWLAVSLVNLGIWAIVSLTAGEWIYPWWVWIAGPWGVMLVVRRVSGR